jgi:hypothetical protein
MNSNIIHFKATIKMTSAKETHQILFPSEIDLSQTKFIVGSCTGFLNSGTPEQVKIYCDELRHHCFFETSTSQMNLIGSTILSGTVSTLDRIFNYDVGGCMLPYGITKTQNFTFSLLDTNQAPLTTLNYLEFELVFIGNVV